MAFGRIGSGGTGFGRLGSIGSGGVAAPAGGAILLTGETNGFATDFTYAVDAQRVAVKTSGTVVASGTSFFTSSGTSSKWVYNAAGVLVNIPVGTLPIDYDPVTHAARGLLVEPAATNLLLSSSLFENWNPQGVTVTANTTASPTGAVDADTLTYAGPAANLLYNAANTTAVAYTFSVFAKVASGTRLFRLRIHDGVADATTADLTATTAWQRFSHTVTLMTTTGYCSICNSAAGSAGDLIVWGAQLEVGSVATSFIPTGNSATVTRAADNYNVTPASIGYSGTAGSWWADVNLGVVAAGHSWLIGVATGGSAPIYMPGSSTIFSLWNDSGGSASKTVPTILGSHKVASAFAVNDEAVTADGLTAATGTGATTSLLAPGTIFFGSAGGGSNMNGYIRKVRYLPRRPSNAELQTMTT